MAVKNALTPTPFVTSSNSYNFVLPSGVVATDYTLVVISGSVPADFTGNTITLTCDRVTATVSVAVAKRGDGNMGWAAFTVTGAQAGDTLTSATGASGVTRLIGYWVFENQIIVGAAQPRSSATLPAGARTVVTGITGTTGYDEYVFGVERTNNTGTPSYSNSAGYTVTEQFFYDLGDAVTDPATSYSLSHIDGWTSGTTGDTTIQYGNTGGVLNAAGFTIESAPAPSNGQASFFWLKG